MTITELGAMAVKRGDYQEAVNIFRRALEQRKDAEAYFGFGLAHYHLEDLLTARWAFHKALELNRDHREAKDYLVRIEGAKRSLPAAARGSSFRAIKDHLEVHDGAWKRFFVKGVNIGLGLPGYFPGEFAVKKRTYQQWFKQIAELGANAVRVYTILPPEFYEALLLFNTSGRRLYLFQGVWTELPEKNDFRDRRFLNGFRSEIRNAVDAVYGSAVLPERPGHAHGTYDCDVSAFVAGFILGREWESCAVRGFNELHQRKQGKYDGTFLSLRRGSPFELWNAEICDGLQRYEHKRYGVSHPISTINWPTLDPLDHPSESPEKEERRRQGMRPLDRDVCIEGDDEESFDVSTITVKKGNGFFASYHVYPYYPDFMINDSPDGSNGYRAYLDALKRHHAGQPVLIAEFGVPSSRDTAHWHPGGWEHGRHTDREQGMINGQLMRSIHAAGMAGGILFSWFDEWCKKTWVFGEYAVPPERKPFWYNLQDPEQNYGLLAAYPGYPGRKVTLACREDEWKSAVVLYEKAGTEMAFRFNDGSDDVRRLSRLVVQHDEGFLYLRLETAGAVDFDRAHYVIGLDTVSSGAGERRFPFRTNLLSPVGLTFLVHLAGKEKSRILAAAPYDKYLNASTGMIRPLASDAGAWVMMQNKTNRRRISKDGTRFYPAQVASMSRLRYGCLDPANAAYSSLADFFVRENAVELRIPWTLINFTDPSSSCVLWKERDGLVKRTDGVRVLAISYRPDRDGLVASGTGRTEHHADSLPADLREDRIKRYSWRDWTTPIYHTYLKESYHQYRSILAELPETP